MMGRVGMDKGFAFFYLFEHVRRFRKEWIMEMISLENRVAASTLLLTGGWGCGVALVLGHGRQS